MSLAQRELALFAAQRSVRCATRAELPAGLGVQLQSASVARVLTRTVPPRRCGGARKADPTRQPPGACIQASATAGSAPARHDSGPRGVADGAESAPEARPAAGCARTTDVLPPLRPRSGPLVDTRNQQTPVSELLCRLGASIADGGTPGPALSHTVERGTARAHAAHLCCLRRPGS
ncbi:hypothetical protein EMIHUDRAFT_231488 [Emiliania huxleyi CCMP1516]|uniref:Uncharacterized protein n=2 Tax=Emiliania huxleyi TaxID=2903 RepID=A0A0D3K7G3_EMIH1|nr:hypothetical protein EMIHUDRAFT_231488 [Emiliania huxleyi CCMP1516]EOD31698.1 hypothetical protein EMIHUDRAFT_231488 [Emiliania huxleyi CCMP1516]|eukprot:XP_005784127.1 hypothetical protein EMIHUDRAFT_231488 [Emiliania huxleyi CCMP1516]